MRLRAVWREFMQKAAIRTFFNDTEIPVSERTKGEGV